MLVVSTTAFQAFASSLASPLRPPLRRRFPERSFSRLSQLLTTVLTDIASSTEQLSAVGNRRWSAILDALDRTVRRQLEHFGGREVNTTGDDVVAVFDTPSAALRCTRAVLVSPTIVDLLLVSDFRLIDRGDHVLKGVVEPWSLFAFGEYGA